MRKRTYFWTSTAEAVIALTLILFVVGSINIFSASFVMASQMLNDSYFFFKRHIISFLIGLAAMYFTARSDYHRLKKRQDFLIFLTFGMLLAVHFIGIDANGAKRWLKIGITFQPSEIAKLMIIILTACYLGPRIDLRRRISLKSWPAAVALGAGYLVLKQPDMGTATVIVGLCILMYLLAGIPREEIMLIGIIGVVGVVYLTFAAAYRAERISAWLNPWAYQQTTGYQSVQALLAIGSGGFFGTGLGMGASKFYYLPEAHTDFAYAVLCQEMGFAGAGLVLLLLSAIGIYGFIIALKAKDGMGMMLAAGSTALIVGQAIGNIAMVTGLIPVTGVPLPFISYGGTSLIVNLAAIGFLINIDRYSKEHPDKENDVPETRVKKKSTLKLVRNR